VLKKTAQAREIKSFFALTDFGIALSKLRSATSLFSR
jgi:hypothetical protein